MLPACTVPAGEQRICQPAQCQRGSNNAVSLRSASRVAEISQLAQCPWGSRGVASLHGCRGAASLHTCRGAASLHGCRGAEELPACAATRGEEGCQPALAAGKDNGQQALVVEVLRIKEIVTFGRPLDGSVL